jgi:hypothetical protein
VTQDGQSNRPATEDRNDAHALKVTGRLGVLARRELIAWFMTLGVQPPSTPRLIVTFVCHVARVEGVEEWLRRWPNRMRLVMTVKSNEADLYRTVRRGASHECVGDVVPWLYYPDGTRYKSFVKRVRQRNLVTRFQIREGRVFVNEMPLLDDFVAPSTGDTMTSAPRWFPGATTL